MTVRFPTSSTYWNLRAEQVLNKVFETNALEPVEVAVHEHEIPIPPPARPAAEQPATSEQADRQPANSATGLISFLTVVAVCGTVSSGWLLSHWQSSRDQLAQERNLLMLERLRGASTPQQAAQRTAVVQPEASAALSPPPPEPAWMSELEPLTLEETKQPAMDSPPVATPISATPRGPMPQLTGVVQGPGGNSSAIFQFGSSSFSAGLGEAIGSSGWMLDSISEAGAVIRRNGQRHNLAVGGVF